MKKENKLDFEILVGYDDYHQEIIMNIKDVLKIYPNIKTLEELDKILKDNENKFPVPANTARIDTVDTTNTSSGTDFNVTLRGKYLYDRKNNTFNIDTDSVSVDLVVLLDFEDLPETARRYITLRASSIFQERHLGATELSQFNAQDEARALAAMRNDEVWQSYANMIAGSDTPLSIVTRFGFDRGIW